MDGGFYSYVNLKQVYLNLFIITIKDKYLIGARISSDTK